MDPGYRTGCKVVCLDAQGNLVHNEAIYPHPPQNEKGKAASKVAQLVSTYAIDAIAIEIPTSTAVMMSGANQDTSFQVSVKSSWAMWIQYSCGRRDEDPDRGGGEDQNRVLNRRGSQRSLITS